MTGVEHHHWTEVLLWMLASFWRQAQYVCPPCREADMGSGEWESITAGTAPPRASPSGKYCTMGTTVPETTRPLRITNPSVLADVCLSLGGPRQLFNRAATVFSEFLLLSRLFNCLINHPAVLANLTAMRDGVLVKLVNGLLLEKWYSVSSYM